MQIFQIGKGSCRVEKLMEGKSKVLGRMESGEVFGEISFLEGGKTSATIVADEETEIYAIEGVRLKVRMRCCAFLVLLRGLVWFLINFVLLCRFCSCVTRPSVDASSSTLLLC